VSHRPIFSICIPAYNRACFLRPLLDSIFQQDFKDFEIVVCEDNSAERNEISEIIDGYQKKFPGVIIYNENPVNLGYDGNIRNLVEKASGKFCFFMGNDDLMSPGALSEVANLVHTHKNIGMVLKSYAWFDGDFNNISQVVRYFLEERVFKAGKQAVQVCLRRSGVIAGYIVNRDAAHAAATNQFDGSLYYQMHLTASVLVTMDAVFTPNILVLCRNGIPPDFGNSSSESEKYVPGSFTAQARVNMIAGVIAVVRHLKESKGVDVIDEVMRDYANYFYAYIRDQLNLPLHKYWRLYREFSSMGFSKYLLFHMYFFLAFILGQKRFDWIIKKSQQLLGRSLQFK